MIKTLKLKKELNTLLQCKVMNKIKIKRHNTLLEWYVFTDIINAY